MKDHLITSRLSGLCRMPPDHSVGEEAHIVGATVWCRAHCPRCEDLPKSRLIKLRPVADGQQNFLLPEKSPRGVH